LCYPAASAPKWIKACLNGCICCSYSIRRDVNSCRPGFCAIFIAPAKRNEERSQSREINARYLNPLRFQIADNHYRLCDILRRQVARDRLLVIDKAEDVSNEEFKWFNDRGNYLASSVYMMACMFSCLQKVRDEIPYLRLSSSDDTNLVELILKLQVSLVKQGGVQYVVQTSIGQEMWLPAEARLRTYREFCDLLRSDESRVWLDRVTNFYLEVGLGKKKDRSMTAVSAMLELKDFLDRCVGGGHATASRWAAEGLQLENGGQSLDPATPGGDGGGM
jgi:hypothetical protein